MKQTILTLILGFTLFTYPFYARAENASSIELHILSARTLSGTAGDYVTVQGEITNSNSQAVNNITTYLSLVNADTKMPVDLEDWSAERGLFIETIDAKETFPLMWKIHFVQSGSYTLTIVANIEGNDMPIASKLVYFKVSPKKNLNPGHVLPVALGEPILIIFAFLALRYRKDKKYR
ncbi:hypothetical protein D4Q80_00710 [bacterium]|nr:MAG: hypothetical protein D4Q80_00710 [bacterium]